VLQALYSGFTAVVMPTFELELFLSLVQSRKITFAYIVPPILLLLAKHPIVDKYDLSSIRMLSSGAAPLTEDLVSSVYRRLKIPTKQEYGISEMSAIVLAQVEPIPKICCKYIVLTGRCHRRGKTGRLLLPLSASSYLTKASKSCLAKGRNLTLVGRESCG